MLESLTILTRGGLVLYQHRAAPSLVGADAAATRRGLTRLLASSVAATIDAPGSEGTPGHHIADGLAYVWMPRTLRAAAGDGGGAEAEEPALGILAYPDILFQGPREYLRAWAEALLAAALQAYAAHYYRANPGPRPGEAAAAEATGSSTTTRGPPRPDPAGFDAVFQRLLTDSKTRGTGASNGATAGAGAAPLATANGGGKSGGKNGKEHRHWVDMDARVEQKDMDRLDQNKSSSASAAAASDGGDGTTGAPSAAALEEARLAYLPTAEDLAREAAPPPAEAAVQPDTWSASITGVFQQLVGSKVLQDRDLDRPLQVMQERLAAHNVAQDVAARLGETVRAALRGQRLTSLSRVQTAVQQALEASLRAILAPPHRPSPDLLRSVLAHRGGAAASLFALTSAQRRQRRPYVVLVMGINGIGKTTTLAKLAYFFHQNGCRPLLVAGDTFRSGAVEQLRVHADCLRLPLYSQGYSKDPSGVVRAAIQHAADTDRDVVLVDTAGRMQNNVPLMKALGKLVEENKPDFVIQVCEALVGHDGLNQFRMFQQALGTRGTDGLILTKFDTVGDKVGAAVTLAYETGTPIVFTGTGQKYHHLKKMSVAGVINSLLS